ncbi:MAG: hypothetical protein K6E50_07510 [Lachnospiraceae bacterium]|nr:hypothetical protein [Lachnospiraceae bacterium]
MIDNMMTKVQVNNEIDLCEVVPGKSKRMEEIRHRIEAALQYARISYFLRWQEPGLFARIFLREKPRLVFCINAAQQEDALQVFEELQLTESEVRMLGVKSKNKYIYAGH